MKIKSQNEEWPSRDKKQSQVDNLQQVYTATSLYYEYLREAQKNISKKKMYALDKFYDKESIRC